MKTFQSELQHKPDTLYSLHFSVPIEVVKHFKDLKIDRFLVSFNGSKPYPRAILSYGNEQYYIYINKTVQKEINARIGETFDIKLEADKSKYGMPLPDEMAECLYQMPIANELFDKLSPGKQRNLIFLVAKPKREATRAKKAYQILSYLESVNGKLDFKELNAYFKETNY